MSDADDNALAIQNARDTLRGWVQLQPYIDKLREQGQKCPNLTPCTSAPVMMPGGGLRVCPTCAEILRAAQTLALMDR